MRAIRCLALLTLALAATGCTVVAAAKGGGGIDVTRLEPGMSRAAAEALVGSPVNQWTTPAGVRFAVYEYDAGRVAEPANAAAFAFMDVITLGIWEAVDVMQGSRMVEAHRGHRTTARTVVSYGADDTVLGVFGELDDLPVDGRPR